MATAASLDHVVVTVPSAVVTLKKAAYDRLMILTDALLDINPVDIMGLARLTVLRPCFMSMAYLQEGSLVFAPAYELAFVRAHVFQVTQWLCTLTSRMHVSVHDLTL